eukprot:contig_5469_g1241
MSYLPYNLSSVSPLASTTAALHLLPVLQPLQPSLGETPAVEETAPAGASAATPAADVADIASLLQAAQDETGGSLDDDHCPSVMELDWNSAALLAQLKSVRPGLSATLVRSSPPHAVRMRTTLRTVPKEVSVSDSTALKRALKSFVEISCDNLSSWHVVELRRATVSDAGARALPTVPEPLILDVARRLQLRIVASIVPLDVASPLTAACTSAAVDAMECALVLVTLMMTPGSVAVLRVEETCEAVIDLLRLVLRRVVFPARDPSFEPLPLAPVSRRQSSKPSMGGGSDTCSEDGSEEEDAAAHLDDEVLDDQPSRRTARGPRRRRASRNNAHVRPPDALFSLCCRVVRDWGEALESHDGPDEFGGAQASRLALVLLRSLSVSGVTELQLCACSTICVVFRYYEASRHDLLTELLHKVNRLPVGRSDLRRFRVGGPGVQPSMVRVSSALFLQLVHILGGLAEEELCPVAETAATRLACAQPGSADSRGSLPHIAYLQAVVRMQGAVRAFVDALVAPAFQARDVSVRDAKFLDGKGRDGDVVDAVTVFVEDILALYGLPEWPGADTVVQLLFLSLSKFQQQSSSAEGGSSRGADAHTRASVFAWLGALAARLQAEAVAEAEWRVRDAALSLLCNVFSTLDSLDAAVCATGGTIQHWQDVSAPVVRRFDATFVTNVLPVVSGRLLDLATSVRKRAVGILSQVVADAFLVLLSARRTTALFENDNRLGDTEQLVVDVCALLVTRLADAEDSVRFASQCALRAVLFGYASEKGPRGFRATGRRDGPFAALLAPSDLVVERTRASILVGIVAKAPASTCIRSLVEVLHVSLLATERPALSRLLSLVVAELLAADLGTIESSPERARARADALQRVDASATTDQGCINLAAVGGETTANGTVSVAVARLALSPDVESAAQRRIACSQIVSAFATVDADLVFPFCSLLAPLLKGLDGAPRYQVMVASHVLDTIERVIPVVRPTPSELVGELEEDLSLVICTHRDEQLAAAAIKCICAISPVACAVDRSVNV